MLSSGGSLSLGKQRTDTSLAGTNTEEDLTKRRSLLVSLCWPSLNNRVLDPKLCPSPNKKGYAPLGRREGAAGLARWQNPSRPPDSENRASTVRCYTDLALIHRKRTDAMLGGCAHCPEPSQATTFGLAPAGKLHVEPSVSDLVGTPASLHPAPPPPCSLGKGASLCWEPLDTVHRDPNSTPGKMIAETESNRRRVI